MDIYIYIYIYIYRISRYNKTKRYGELKEKIRKKINSWLTDFTRKNLIGYCSKDDVNEFMM